MQHGTFRALPRVPQVLHADELVVPVEAVVLGFGVVVIQIFSQKLQNDTDVCCGYKARILQKHLKAERCTMQLFLWAYKQRHGAL